MTPRAILLDPRDLIIRLIAAIPPPRFHLVRYFGVLSSHSKFPSEVVPKPPQDSAASLAFALPANAGPGCEQAAAALLAKLGLAPQPPPTPVILVPHPHVRVDTSVLGGSPYVVGSRVPVRRLFAFFDSGVKVETILKRFPQLDAAKVFDALAFALDNPTVLHADI